MTPWQALDALHANADAMETLANLCAVSKDLHLLSGEGMAALLDMILAKQRDAVTVLQKQSSEWSQ